MWPVRIFRDATRRRRLKRVDAEGARIAQEIANRLSVAPICSNYENLFAQVRPLINQMKTVRPYGVSVNGKRLPVTRTPELQLLDAPNDDMGWADFADLCFATWLTESELDIHVWFDRGGNVAGYTVLPPQTRHNRGRGVIEWQTLNDNGDLVTYTEDSVMRLRFSRSPRNPDMGVSPATSVAIYAQIDDLFGQYQRAYIENGAVPASITFITASTKEKFLETKAELEGKLKGAENRNKTVYAWRQLLDDGSAGDQIEVKTIQGDNSTLAMRELMGIVNDRLNKAVGVSNFLMGDDSSAKYDNAELSDNVFTRRVVYPALLSFWSQFQSELDRITGGLGYGIDFEIEIPDLTDRLKTKSETAEKNVGSLTKLIEAGSTPLGAVRALELGDRWNEVATAIYSSKVAKSSVEGSAGMSTPQAQDTKTDDLPGTLLEKLDVKATLDTVSTVDDADPEEVEWNEDEKDEEAIYNGLMDLAEAEAYDALANSEVEVPEEIAGNVPKTTAEGVVDAIVDILVGSAENGARDGFKAVSEQLQGEQREEVAKKAEAPVVSDGLQGRLKVRTEDLVGRYGEYTRTVVDNALLNEKPQSAAQIRKTLQKVIPKGRAALIARNETTYALRSGQLDADKAVAEQYGLKISLIWRCHHDGATCPVCAAMDGEETELGTAFPDSVEKDGVKHAWEHSIWNDSGEIPDAHVNCRCYYEEKVEVL